MRTFSIPALLFGTLLLAACGEDAPQPTTTAEANAPRPVAEQERELAAKFAEQKAALDQQSDAQRRASEKAARIQAVRGIATKLVELRQEAGKTGRSDLEKVLPKFNALKSEAGTIEVDDCTRRVRDSLVASIDRTVQTINHFRQQSGAPDAQSQQGAEEAQNLLMEADKQLATCFAN